MNTPWDRLTATLKQWEQDQNNDGCYAFKPSPADVRKIIEEHTRMLHNLVNVKDFLEGQHFTKAAQYVSLCKTIEDVSGLKRS